MMPYQKGRPRHADILSGRDLGDEYLFYDRKGDQVHILNGTAREIYLLCDGTRTQEEVIQALMECYAVDEETARRDVAETVRQLVELDLLVFA